MTVGVKICEACEAKDTIKKYENLGYRFVGEENVGEGYLKLIFRVPVIPTENSITDIRFHEGDFVENNELRNRIVTLEKENKELTEKVNYLINRNQELLSLCCFYDMERNGIKQ